MMNLVGEPWPCQGLGWYWSMTDQSNEDKNPTQHGWMMILIAMVKVLKLNASYKMKFIE